jgi:hypothetical protein
MLLTHRAGHDYFVPAGAQGQRNAGDDWHLFVSSLHPAVNDRWMQSIGTTPFHMWYDRHFLFRTDMEAISQVLARIDTHEWVD